MPRKLERALSPMKVKTAKAGMHCDGGGLYLQVTPAKDGRGFNRSWVFRFRANGRLRDMGLGPLSTIGLADAREKARELRAKRLDNIDPIEERRAARAVPVIKLVTFYEEAQAFMAKREVTWTNAVHRKQWRTSLEDHAYPVVGKLAVRDVEISHVRSILDPIWNSNPESANRLRGRIESILDFAKVSGNRSGENPARWRGHLSNIYPKPADVREAIRKHTGHSGHHAALPYAEVAAFVAALRGRQSVAARAFEFLILTAARTGEVLGARWAELDMAQKVWTIPAGRMKASKEHRVPLSPRALAIVAEMAKTRQGEHVFPGDREDDEPLSNMALVVLRRQMKIEVTTHGFRSSFRDWAADCTNYPGEIAEAALAHAISDKTEAAYKRTDFFDKRARLMTEWANYCARPTVSAKGAKVLPLHKKQRG